MTLRITLDAGWLPELLLFLGCLQLAWLWLAWRVVRAFETLVANDAKRRQAAPILSGPIASQFEQIGKKAPETLSVPQVSPEAILKRTPKPAGFGGKDGGNG